MRSTTHLRKAFLLGSVVLASCNSDATSDVFVGPPAIVKVTGGSDISAEVATDAGPFVFAVTDTGGNGVSGIPVVYTISGPATLVTTSGTTDNSGSTFTSIHFGNTAGAVTITATANGISTPAVLHTSSYAAAVSKLVIIGGNAQSGVHGALLGDNLAVLVTDTYDNPVINAQVTWTTTGLGTITTPSARTGADGRVNTTFRLPATPGDQTVTASIQINGATVAVNFTLHGT